MLVYYFVPFIVSNRYLLFWVSNGHNFVTVQNRTHVYINFYHHKDLGNHLVQLCPKVVKHPVYIPPIPVTAWSKAWVCGRSLAGIVGSNPAGGLDFCLSWVLFAVRWRSLRRTDHSSRGVPPSVVYLCVILKPQQRWGLGTVVSVEPWTKLHLPLQIILDMCYLFIYQFT